MLRLFISVLLLLSCLFQPALAAVDQGNYLVGSGDVLKISVYDNADLETVARIDNTGSILFPLVGQLSVAGMSVPEVAVKVEKALADGYLIDPHVTVFIQEYRSNKVIVSGQVNHPGVHELSGPTSLLELISMAGGLRETAANHLTITRTASSENGTPKVIDIDLKELLETGSPDLNVAILNQDNVFIPKAGMIFIRGEVEDPDGYKYEEGMTVLKVVSMAGDFKEFAAKKKIRIIRIVAGQENVLENVSLHEPVFPGDIIEVPESFF